MFNKNHIKCLKNRFKYSKKTLITSKLRKIYKWIKKFLKNPTLIKVNQFVR